MMQGLQRRLAVKENSKMANGMGSLYIGASGLQNSQNALNTTANNLANVETKGYVRQQVLFADRQ